MSRTRRVSRSTADRGGKRDAEGKKQGGLVDGSRPVEVVLFPPSRRLGDGDAGRSRARADVIDEGVVDGS